MIDAMISILIAAAVAKGVPPEMLLAVCTQESNLRPLAVNVNDGGSASYGLCQIKSSTAHMLHRRSTPDSLLDARHNASVAADYLALLLRRYPGDAGCAIAAYNAGTCRHNRKGQIRNMKYVRSVQNHQRNYERILATKNQD